MDEQKTYADALNDIFATVSKHSKIRVIRSHDRYGDEIIVESKRYFIPVITREAEKNAIHYRKIFFKPRKTRYITVGGLERYFLYLYKKWKKEQTRITKRNTLTF